MVCTIFLRKQAKRVYTMCPERRVYAIEPQTPKKKNQEGFHDGGVYFFLPCLWDSGAIESGVGRVQSSSMLPGVLVPIFISAQCDLAASQAILTGPKKRVDRNTTLPLSSKAVSTWLELI